MTVAVILPQPASPDPVLSALASALTHTHAADPAYGIPFSRALGRAVEHAGSGIAYEPYNATHYRVQSGSRAWLWYYVTLDQCSCEARGPWCWHRALIHLLTARAALQTLDRCPRPVLVQLAPSTNRDYADILREADELYQGGPELCEQNRDAAGRGFAKPWPPTSTSPSCAAWLVPMPPGCAKR